VRAGLRAARPNSGEQRSQTAREESSSQNESAREKSKKVFYGISLLARTATSIAVGTAVAPIPCPPEPR
jgi:hypothetical protein